MTSTKDKHLQKYLPDKVKTIEVLDIGQVIHMLENDDAIIVRANRVQYPLAGIFGYLYSHLLMYNPKSKSYHWFYNAFNFIKEIGPRIEYFYNLLATVEDSSIHELMNTENLDDFENNDRIEEYLDFIEKEKVKYQSKRQMV